MENKKNGLIIGLIVIIVILCCTIGWLLVSKIGENDSVNDQTPENNNIVVDKEDNSNNIDSGDVSNNSIQLKNYNIDEIKNIEVSVPVKNATDPEMKKVIIADKEEMKSILLNVDDIKEVGKVLEGIGFTFNVTITINYDGDPSTAIIILDNGNVAINKAVGVGETGYVEYEISNSNLRTQIIDKYQD